MLGFHSTWCGESRLHFVLILQEISSFPKYLQASRTQSHMNHLDVSRELQNNKPNCLLDIPTWIFGNISNITCIRGLLLLSRTSMSGPNCPQAAHLGNNHLHPLRSSSHRVAVLPGSCPPPSPSTSNPVMPWVGHRSRATALGIRAMAFPMVSPCLPAPSPDQSLHTTRVTISE